jgi:hypothetical protein
MRRHLKFLDDNNGLSVTKLIYDKFAEQIRIGHERARGMRFDVDKLRRIMNHIAWLR